MSKVIKLLSVLWWSPSWYMTRLVIYRYPGHAWTRTTNINQLMTWAAPLMHKLNFCIWFVLIEIVFLLTILFTKYL